MYGVIQLYIGFLVEQQARADYFEELSGLASAQNRKKIGMSVSRSMVRGHARWEWCPHLPCKLGLPSHGIHNCHVITTETPVYQLGSGLAQVTDLMCKQFETT